MPLGFLALPAEIKVMIIRFLVPFICEPDTFPTDARTIADDLEPVFENMPDIRALAQTCSDLRQFYHDFSFRAMKLEFNNDGIIVPELDDGSLPPPICDTLFLRLESCEDTRPVEELDTSELDESIERFFQHFSSVKTLDTCDFPMSLESLIALRHLHSLRTLSLRFPDNSYGYFEDIQDIQHTYTFPKLSSLNVLVHDIGEAVATSNVVKLFERSITTLSISGNDYIDEDFLAAIMLNAPYDIALEELRHLNIDFLGFSACTLRTVICKSINSLESISVDCRGTVGFLPLFYVIDLIRLVIGEGFDSSSMMEFDGPPQYFKVGINEYVPGVEEEGMYVPGTNSFIYPEEAKIWTAYVARFFCKFSIVENELGTRRMLDTLELYFASQDEENFPINIDMRFRELSEVFRTRMPTFDALKTLVIATERTLPLRSAETEVQLKDTTEILLRYSPSINRVTVRWGDQMQFRCTRGGISGKNEMDVDLWTFPFTTKLGHVDIPHEAVYMPSQTQEGEQT